jgi:hypothetical protein
MAFDQLSPTVSSVIVVLGMHRSGTSALAGVLSALGYDFGQNLLPPTPGVNEKGFWEHADVVRVHEDLLSQLGSSWHDPRPLPDQWTTLRAACTAQGELVEIVRRDFGRSKAWGLKDPRLCRLLPLWHAVFDELGVRPCFVLCHRNPYEIAASIRRRDGFSIRKSLILWLAHSVEAERLTRGRRRAFVSYDSLLRDWRPAMTDAASRLKVTWPLPLDQAAAAVDAFLEPSLRHHRDPAEVRREAGEAGSWIETWSNLTEALAGGTDEKAELQAVRVGAQVEAAFHLLGPELIGREDEDEVAQVFYPQDGLYSEARSLTARFRTNAWETLRFTLPPGALESMAPLRFDPCATTGVVTIGDISLRTCTDPTQTLFRAETPALLDRLTVGGTARRLPESWGLVMLSLGVDSQVVLPAVPVPPGPLELEVRLKIERVPALESLTRILEARERDEVARLTRELDLGRKLVTELQAEAARVRGHATRLAGQIARSRRKAVARQRFVSSLRAEMARLGGELAKTREAAEQNERRMAEVTADREERERIAQALRSEVSSLTRELDEIRSSGWWANGTRLVRIRAMVLLGIWRAEGIRGFARRIRARPTHVRSKRPAEVTGSSSTGVDERP